MLCWEHVWNGPLGRSKNAWEDTIKSYLRDLEYEDVKWIKMARNYAYWGAFVELLAEFKFGLCYQRVNCSVINARLSIIMQNCDSIFRA
jgi:uncharacterized protein YozE (UPF0346 family)